MIEVATLQKVICNKDFLGFLDCLGDYEKSLLLSFQKPIATTINEFRSELSIINWQEHEDNLAKDITKSLQNFISITNGDTIPESGLKGVYFCLGDNGEILQISGSRYYREQDWSANADFYSKCDEACSVLEKISKFLRDQGLEKNYVRTIEYFFVIYVLYRLMDSIKITDMLANSGVSLGYSDGAELIIGHFDNYTFIGELKVVYEYEKLSSAPVVTGNYAKRGNLWDYLRHNYYSYLKSENLENNFIMLGEAEAERICKMYQGVIKINRCNKCGFIKKTPKSNLCLNCGDFT